MSAMKRTMKRLLSTSPATALATCALTACAVNPTLMFGDSVTYGLQIGSDAGGVGTGGSVGYKHRSVAVVPVSVLNHLGEGKAIRGSDGSRRKDALSVFASFDNTVPADGNGSASVGQVFATGSAAQLLTLGIMCQLTGSAACEQASAQRATEAAGRADAGAQPDTQPTLPPQKGEPPPLGTDRPYQSPLYFGRTDSLGIGLAASAAEQGVQFDLGYSSRNLALVPVYTQSAAQRVDGLVSEHHRSQAPIVAGTDAMSVLGQFDLNTQTRALGLTLTRYFSTGVAAQNIAAGLSHRMAASASAPSP